MDENDGQEIGGDTPMRNQAREERLQAVPREGGEYSKNDEYCDEKNDELLHARQTPEARTAMNNAGGFR